MFRPVVACRVAPGGCLMIRQAIRPAIVSSLALLAATLASGSEAPTNAVLADLDRGGEPQLWVGWRTTSGGRLETWPPGRTVVLPVAPDLLGTGDFNADGRLDLIVAARDDNGVWVLPRREDGELGPGARVALAGRVTAALAGDLNRVDGLADFVVAVDSGAGASLLVFEDPHGAFFAQPEIVALPAPATELAIAMLDDDGFGDIAAGCGEEVVVVHGRDRAVAHAGPTVTKSAAPFPIDALVAGRFGSAIASPARLAIADRDGHLAVSTLEGGWRQVVTPVKTHGTGLRLNSAKVTGHPGDDLVAFDRESGSVEIYGTDPENPGRIRLVERRSSDILGSHGISIASATSSRASLFVVDDAGDASDALPGDGVCGTGTASCTLRAAIEESNASPGVDSIQFALGAGNPIIAPASPLPAISEAVALDGSTGGATRVVLNGASAGAGANGLVLGTGSNGSAVRSFVLRGFGAAGIRIEGGNNVVEACYIGTDDSGGSSATGNHDGVVLSGATANGNTIGGTSAAQRNVIANNSTFGVYVTASAAPNTIAGNYIGIGATGGVAVPNGNTNVRIDETTANAVWVGGSVASPGVPPGNVIAGSISVSAGSGDLIQGNLIGFDSTGATVLGPGSVVIFAGSNATVGGPTVAERNVVRTVSIGFTASNMKVQGNYVGVDISGTVAVGGGGVSVTDGPFGTLVGGAAASFGMPPGNVISGNAAGSGVLVAQGALRNPTSASLLGNIIGLDATGTAALANQRGVQAGSRGSVTLGGENPGEGNLISGNSAEGVWVPGGSVVAKGNRIVDNGSHGITLQDGGAGGTPATATIGGTTTGARNVISGNTLDGIRSGQGATTTVVGNWIGVGPDGSQPMGNGGAGLSFFGVAGTRSIGGSSGLTAGACTGSCNLIANNGLDGVALSGVQGFIPIRGNVFRANGDLGIDLDAGGPTLNDPGDGDNGSNGLQNFPVVTSRTYDGVGTTIQGTLSSAASTGYTIDVYSNAAKDPSGYGEGEVWLGSTSCTTDAAGSCSWGLVATGSHDFVAATATSAAGATSELSRTYTDDLDGDGILNSADNCVELANPFQADTDADGVGNLCDNCVSVANVSQIDTDVDGAGDACDCQPLDPTDRRPAEVTGPSVQKDSVDPALTHFSWSSLAQADRYSVTRGELASLGATEFGACVADGVFTFTDSTVPAADHGFFYLVAGQNFNCGLGSWGKLSSEQERVNGNPGACTGLAVATVHATSESTVSGTPSGTLSNTLSSDDQYESITEILSGGSPANRFSFLEHRWTFSVGPGNKDLRVEGFRTASPDGDGFGFECSINGTTWTALPGSLPLSDNNVDLSFSVGLSSCVPAGYSGAVTIRVVDTNHTPGSQNLDTVSFDEIFLRVVP